MKESIILKKASRVTLVALSCLFACISELSVADGEKVFVDAEGAGIFNHYCVVCHGRGRQYPGTMSLEKLYGWEKAALEDRDNLTADFVRYLVRNGRGMMPGFRPAEINEQELAAMATFLANGPHPVNNATVGVKEQK